MRAIKREKMDVKVLDRLKNMLAKAEVEKKQDEEEKSWIEKKKLKTPQTVEMAEVPESDPTTSTSGKPFEEMFWLLLFPLRLLLFPRRRSCIDGSGRRETNYKANKEVQRQNSERWKQPVPLVAVDQENSLPSQNPEKSLEEEKQGKQKIKKLENSMFYIELQNFVFAFFKIWFVHVTDTLTQHSATLNLD